MTREQRIKEFNQVFDAIPGKNDKERIDVVCGILFCKENSIRIYRMNEPTRVIPESKLRILKTALQKQ